MKDFAIEAGVLTVLAFASACGGDGRRSGVADSGTDAAHQDGGRDATVDGSNPGNDAGTFSCTYFCQHVLEVCTGDNDFYGTLEDCMIACDEFPLGTEGDSSGNTLACRIYHLGLAEQDDPVAHCPHTSVDGALTCVD